MNDDVVVVAFKTLSQRLHVTQKLCMGVTPADEMNIHITDFNAERLLATNDLNPDRLQ